MSTSELQPGARAPDFDLAADGGGRTRLADFAGGWLVVYFYPKDDTPGCTTEAIGFSEAVQDFAAAGAKILGVSKDSAASHDRFKAKHNLTFTLAADPEGTMVERYGVWVEKNMYGRKYMGIERATFLIDPEGVIREIWRKVKVPGHVAAVLDAVGQNGRKS
jgi:peroxiredoxin Q/BCP